jgi:RNA polymerase sigma-70 factor (ECF subfamily)
MELEARIQELFDQGEEAEAAGEVMRALGPGVLGCLRAMLRDEAEAADAFSAFAEALLRGLASFRGESSLRTWALRLAMNEAFDVRADPWRRRVRRFVTREASALADEVRRSSVVRDEGRRREVERLRRELSPRDQALLVLHVDQGLSWPEVAEVLAASGDDTSAAALSKRYERLKERLRELARREGLIE